MIHDTAGEEKHQSIMHRYYRNADIALIVYDITDAESFYHIQQHWKNDVLQHSQNEDVKIILVGNKIDKDCKRVVDQRIAEQYAQDNGMSFIEMSAKNSDHFDLLNNQIRRATEQVLAIGGSYFHRSEQSSGIHLEHRQERLNGGQEGGEREGGGGGGGGGEGGGGGRGEKKGCCTLI